MKSSILEPACAFVFPARPTNGGPLPKARRKHHEHAYEPKLNGWRTEIHAPSRTMWNRHGELLSIAGEFNEALDALEILGHTIGVQLFDCEALERRHGIGRGCLFILDIIPTRNGELGTKEEPTPPKAHPEFPHSAFRAPSWIERSAWLDRGLGRLPCHVKPEPGRIYRPDLLPGDLATWEKLQLVNREWGAEFYEGLVAKREDSPYPFSHNATTTTPHWIKHRWAF